MLTQTVSFYNLGKNYGSDDEESCHAYPNGKLLQLNVGCGASFAYSCHAYPNGKLLQRNREALLRREQVVMLTQTVSFYNDYVRFEKTTQRVVMLTQTVSFYNAFLCKRNQRRKAVVMLTQTVSFYNTPTCHRNGNRGSCHAYPNGKLLQRLEVDGDVIE